MRHNLTPGQKSHITRKAREYKEVLENPKAFHIVNLKGDSAKLFRESKKIKITKSGKAFIPLQGYKSAKVRKGVITFDSDKLEKKTYYVGAKGFYAQLAELSKKKLPRNAMVTAQIGDNSPFNVARFNSLRDLDHYVTNIFTPKDPGESKNRLIGLMSIVTLKNENAPRKKGKK